MNKLEFCTRQNYEKREQMIKVGTRVRMKNRCLFPERVSGRIFTVTASDDIGVAIKSCDHGPESVYRLTEGAFSDYFEVIGMEEPKKFAKQAEDEALVGDYTETELDELWKLAGSYEALKALLKLGVKWHPSKQPKKQRQWTPWKIHPITGLPFSVSHQDGKSSKVKVKCGAFVGIASCNPEDDWDIDLGIKLAAARAEVKRTKALANEKMENLRSIMRQIYGKAVK